MSERCVAGTSSSFRNYLQSRQYKNYDCQESFFLLPSLLPSLFSPVWFLGSWESKIPSFGVVPVKMAKSSGATFSKIQVDVASKCCQVVKNDRILADEGPFQHFLAILAHFMPTSTRIVENGTARFRCLSGVSRALLFPSETISKVGNIKIMSARSPFFFSPLSPPFSFLSRVVSRLMGVKNTQFRCRSGENGQSSQYENYECKESFFLLPSLLPSLFSPVWFLGSWESKIPSFGVVPVKMAKS